MIPMHCRMDRSVLASSAVTTKDVSRRCQMPLGKQYYTTPRLTGLTCPPAFTQMDSEWILLYRNHIKRTLLCLIQHLLRVTGLVTFKLWSTHSLCFIISPLCAHITIYPFYCWWAFGQLPVWSYYARCHCEHTTCVFQWMYVCCVECLDPEWLAVVHMSA